MTSPANASSRGYGATIALFLGAPLVWALHLLASYFIITMGCRGTLLAPKAWLAGITIAALLLAAFIGVRAWRLSHRALASEAGSPGHRAEASQSTFLLTTGAFLSGVFLFGIILLGLPLIILPVCP